MRYWEVVCGRDRSPSSQENLSLCLGSLGVLGVVVGAGERGGGGGGGRGDPADGGGGGAAEPEIS